MIDQIPAVLQAGFAVVQLGLLAGIFYRLGKLGGDVEETKRRVDQLEARGRLFIHPAEERR